MTRKHYTAAVQGEGGIFSALRHTFSSRFTAIRAFVMIPSKSEKLELSVSRDARTDDDIVTLKRTNWHTGKENILYNGKLMGGVPINGRLPREG